MFSSKSDKSETNWRSNLLKLSILSTKVTKQKPASDREVSENSMGGVYTPTMSSSDEIIEMSDSETHELRIRAGMSLSDLPKMPPMPYISRKQTAQVTQELNLPPLQELDATEGSRQSTPPLSLQLSNDNLSISSQWGYSMASVGHDDDDSLFDSFQLDECSRHRIRDENGSISMAFMDPQVPSTPPYALYDSNDECESVLPQEISASSRTSRRMAPYELMQSLDDMSTDTVHIRQQSQSQSVSESQSRLRSASHSVSRSVTKSHYRYESISQSEDLDFQILPPRLHLLDASGSAMDDCSRQQSCSVSYMTHNSEIMLDLKMMSRRRAAQQQLPALPSSPVQPMAKDASYDQTVKGCDVVIKDPFHLLSASSIIPMNYLQNSSL